MPLTLFTITAVTVFLSRIIERKLKFALGEREFRVRDAVLLVVAISVTVSLIIFVPEIAVITLFLFAYSVLLFIFTYLFSDFSKSKAKIFLLVYMILAFSFATLSLIILWANNSVTYGAFGFYCLLGFAFVALLYEEVRFGSEERWYLAALLPASFICLYLFFNGTPIWFPYLLNMFGMIFAVLISLYMGSLFTWKTSIIFVTLLTIMDVILVLFTGSMVSAASHVSSLRLPIMISLPTIPIILTRWGKLYMSLGLGDFFFAGLIGVQTLKRFGLRTAIISLISMSVSFFIFVTFMLTYGWIAFPGTLMIICGWIPILLWKILSGKSEIKNK
ncbi:MAG: hypothetical protein PVH12_04755 [Candidatus Bathyarchaeota archaeon]